jgi:hypothetical protein
MLLKRNVLHTALIFTAVLILNSCYFDGSSHFNRIQGEGQIVSEDINLSKIHGIVIKNSANVSLTQGDKQRLVVEAQRNILDNLKTEVSNGILYIGNRNPVWKTKPVQVKLRISDLSIVRMSGSGDISSTNTFTDLDDLEVKLSGSGKIELSLEAREVYSIISGSGSINLDGEARKGEFTISGSGSIRAYDLRLRKANARISGSGSIHTHVEENLEVRVTGSGSITYQGDPKIEKHISGSGGIRSR